MCASRTGRCWPRCAKELAELEGRIILRLNGPYVRRTECELHNALLEERIEGMMRQKREAASD